jgi:hypothetical protein
MDVKTALARLPPTRIHPLRRIVWAVISTKELPDPIARETEVGYRVRQPDAPTRRIASEEQRRTAERLGFRRLGVFRQTTLLFSRVDTEVFVDDDSVARLSSSKTFDVFDTYLDDGSCVMTWTRLSTPGGKRVVAETGEIGTGDLEQDLQLHRARVAKRGVAGRTPLKMTGADDYAAMAKHYMLREIPLSIAMRYAMMLFFMIALGVFVAARVAMALFGRASGC